MSIIQKLSEGMVNRDMKKEGEKIPKKGSCKEKKYWSNNRRSWRFCSFTWNDFSLNIYTSFGSSN